MPFPRFLMTPYVTNDKKVPVCKKIFYFFFLLFYRMRFVYKQSQTSCEIDRVQIWSFRRYLTHLFIWPVFKSMCLLLLKVLLFIVKCVIIYPRNVSSGHECLHTIFCWTENRLFIHKCDLGLKSALKNPLATRDTNLWRL